MCARWFPQILDGASLDDSKDVLLLVGLGALVLVGVFATELANESWDLVQAEVKADQAERERLEAEGVADALIVEADERWNGMLGPLNTSSVTGAVVSLVPNTARIELAEVWTQCRAFCDEQWHPAVVQAVARKRLELERQEKVKTMLATLAQGGKAERSLLDELRAPLPKLEEQPPSAADLASLARMARWTLAAEGPWREITSALLFSFALAASARQRWDKYPQSYEELELLVDSSLAAADLGDARTATAATAAPLAPVASVAARPAAPPARAPVRSLEEIAKERAAIDEQLAAVDERLRQVKAAEKALKESLSQQL